MKVYWLIALVLLSATANADVVPNEDAEIEVPTNIEGVDTSQEIPAGQPQIPQEVFEKMLETISPECRLAIEASPEDVSGLSDECKVEIQTTLHTLMGGEVRDPNDPVTPEMFEKLMKTIPAECRAEIEANPNDPSKFSDKCKRHIQSTLSRLIAKEKRQSEASKDEQSSKPKKQRKGKKEPKSNSGTLLIVLGFVFTALAGVGAYAYTVNKKLAAAGTVDKSTQKKVSKNKKEKERRRDAAAAAASIN